MTIRSLVAIGLALVILTGCQTGREYCGIYEDVDPRHELVLENQRFIRELRYGFCTPSDANFYYKVITAGVLNGEFTWKELEIDPKELDRLVDQYQQ